jgi:hypothetical protein
MAAAVETFDLSKDYRVGFWRPKPYRALDRVTFRVEASWAPTARARPPR